MFKLFKKPSTLSAKSSKVLDKQSKQHKVNDHCGNKEKDSDEHCEMCHIPQEIVDQLKKGNDKKERE